MSLLTLYGITESLKKLEDSLSKTDVSMATEVHNLIAKIERQDNEEQNYYGGDVEDSHTHPVEGI